MAGMTGRIGADIRALRKARGITLQALCQAVGRSVGWLSQVERGMAEPSVRDLGLIADRLGVSISLFFRSASQCPKEQGIVLRNDERVPIGSRESGLIEELLSPSLSGSFEMIRSVFEPGADSGGPPRPRERRLRDLRPAHARDRRRRLQARTGGQLPIRGRRVCLAQRDRRAGRRHLGGLAPSLLSDARWR